MKLQLYVLLLFVATPICAMVFDLEDQNKTILKRTRSKKNHVAIKTPFKECGICYEDKHLTGTIPCEQGEKHPEICDECMHKFYEDIHASTGRCPFCRRGLFQSQDLSCSICKEKFKSTQKTSVDFGCFSCFVVACRAIRSFFTE